MLTTWLEHLIDAITQMAPEGSFLNQTFNVNGLIAVVLVGLVCGAVGSMVVGNRMAFFSDCLAHSAFTGVALGYLLGLSAGIPRGDPFFEWAVPLIMVGFGLLIGAAISYVRDRTGLASDTVIGVFFAGAIGFGAVFMKALGRKGYFNLEAFLFGDPLNASTGDLIVLLLLVVGTAVVLMWMYNRLVFTSFNPSLARSRNIPVRLCNYLFIGLLALIINLCLFTVGTLLINAMLVVPAATASNFCRNMRQLFWATTGLSLLVSVVGHVLTWEIGLRTGLELGIGGTIVVVGVLLFFLSMALAPLVRGRQPA
jgi:zinc transport system permease protein